MSIVSKGKKAKKKKVAYQGGDWEYPKNTKEKIYTV